MARRPPILTAARVGLALAIAIAVTLLPPRSARTQTLQRLTVESFALSSDAVKPQLEVPFHLVLTLRVRERVAAIDNLELPILAELELLGDERRIEAQPGGTLYRETIAVVAHHTGDVTIAPATLQAIDARDRRPKQYFSNSLTLHVVGGSLEPLERGESFAVSALRFAAKLLLWTAVAIAAIAAGVLLFRRRRAPIEPAAAEPVPAPAAPPAYAPRSRRDRLQDALTVLRAEPTRASAVRVRSLLWRMAGASDGETLADVLQRPESNDVRLRSLLRALERAAFTYDADVLPAIAHACDALERYIS